jgi:hypothetical protein
MLCIMVNLSFSLATTLLLHTQGRARDEVGPFCHVHCTNYFALFLSGANIQLLPQTQCFATPINQLA